MHRFSFLENGPSTDGLNPIRLNPLANFSVGKSRRDNDEIAYNAQSLGTFLGWRLKDGRASDRIYTALTALEYIEEGFLKEQDFAEITSSARFSMENLTDAFAH
jgi:hypothetical protein